MIIRTDAGKTAGGFAVGCETCASRTAPRADAHAALATASRDGWARQVAAGRVTHHCVACRLRLGISLAIDAWMPGTGAVRQLDERAAKPS